MNPSEILARAKAYPFPRPDSSVILVGDRLFELIEVDHEDLSASRLRSGDSIASVGDVAAAAGAPPEEIGAPRTAVLAYGSNASPESLRWKFPDHVAVLPLLRGTAGGLDVVYSAHMTVYGSIAATLQASPGTTAEVFVALLTEAQLERVTAWEINATPEGLDGTDIELECAPPPAEVTAFISRHGCLTKGETEIAVADVPGEDRCFPAMTEPEVLEHARTIAAPNASLDDFILEGVRDYSLAQAYTETLKRTARPFRKPRTATPETPSRRGDSNP